MTTAREQEEFASELVYHRREWIVQRVGWVGMLLFIVAACFGLFGGQGAFTMTRGSAEDLLLEYDRFARYASDTAFILTVGKANGGIAVIEADDDFMRNVAVVSILPEPASMRSIGGRLRLTFAIDRLPATITMRLKPHRVGPLRGVFQLHSAAPIHVEQFVYP